MSTLIILIKSAKIKFIFWQLEEYFLQENGREGLSKHSLSIYTLRVGL